MPGVTAFFGKSLLDGTALQEDFPWLPAVFVISSILTGGAVLRVTCRVFLGWGRPRARRTFSCASRPSRTRSA
ncbi:MAG TPA: hypothetical protein VMA96_16500 [Solirubrobacteraceae bacterium]|nr:hypothetical protein [Solirubrobacteraceae bacterium]